MLSEKFSSILHAAAGNAPLQALTIIFATFILEDVATLLAAMQVAAGAVSLPLALGALYAGIFIGDTGLYVMGWLSTTFGWVRRLVPRRRRDIGREWVQDKVFPLVLVSRFVPGLRVPTYTTLGVLHAPFFAFALAAIGATLVWTTGLFFLSLKLGFLLLRYLGAWRWAGIAVFAALILLAGRYAAKLYKNKLQEKGIT
jgi:membrane protein DedA with SNARE-associated domain